MAIIRNYMSPAPGEEWRTCREDDFYMVSNYGRVARRAGTPRTRYDRLLIGGINDKGYKTVVFYGNNRPKLYRVHRLVVDAFIRELAPEDVVNHLDGCKTNNRVENLEITDRAGNAEHAKMTGLYRSGERHGMAKLTDNDVAEIRARFKAGASGQYIANAFGISRNYAYQIGRGEERAA